MELRSLGNSDIQVTPLGFGAGLIGQDDMTDKEASMLLNGVLDLGINFIDTARGYGLSERRIGQSISHRRHEYVLSTKVGYGIEGYEDWTYECVRAGIDAALATLQTDYLDIVHLHSCPQHVLQHNGVIDAVDQAVVEGKVRLNAYSGENDDAAYAVYADRFGSIMTSINFCDQRFVDNHLWESKQRGLGVIAKRPIANAPWRFADRPAGHYCEEYWHRWQTMNIDPGMEWLEFAIRFSAYLYGVDTCIVGSTKLPHIAENIAMIENGKLPEDLIESARSAFRQHDQNWIGQL